MPTVPLPEKPSLEQLRKQARELQRAAHAGSPDAVDLVTKFHLGADPDHLPLSTAQLVLARCYGFPSWPRLVAHLAVVAAYQRVQADVEAGADPATEFLDLACLRYDDDGPHRWEAARRLLAAHPIVTEAGIHVAAACADADRVHRLLAAEPGLARAEGGPQRWQPLMQLAYARHDPGVRSEAVLDTARLLLRHGADPNAGYLFQGLPTPFTVLTGVFGGGEDDQPPHPHANALAEVLLVAGADPNDGQALYNRMFSPDDDHLRLLLAHGLGTGDGGPWHARMPDATDTPTQMLRNQLGWAATHGLVERIRLLAAHHVDVCSPLPGPLFPDGRTPAELAAMAGRPEVVALLVELGAPAPDPSPMDALMIAALAADPAAVEHVRARHPDALPAARAQHPGLVVRAAATGRVDAVRLLVELGFSVDALGRADLPIDQPWETALHHAAGAGDVAMVEVLLSLGASPDVRDARFDATPIEWASHEQQAPVVDLLEASRSD